MSFEGPPTKPEIAIRSCPECSGTGRVKDDGVSVACKRCHGTGQIRSNA